MGIFRGSFQATIDDKGRLKLPARLKSQLDEWHGPQVFVTSLAPGELRVYPLGVWEELEQRLTDTDSLLSFAYNWLRDRDASREELDIAFSEFLNALLSCWNIGQSIKFEITRNGDNITNKQ